MLRKNVGRVTEHLHMTLTVLNGLYMYSKSKKKCLALANANSLFTFNIHISTVNSSSYSSRDSLKYLEIHNVCVP